MSSDEYRRPDLLIPSAREKYRPPIPENALPKRVWLLWLQGWDAAPPVARRCAALWRSQNRDWDIELVSAANIAEYLDGFNFANIRHVSPNHQSDLIRLHLLEQHGGVWADAAVVCRRPLNDWLPPFVVSGFFAFSRPARARQCASWFMASTRGGPIVTTVREMLSTYLSSNDFSPPGRLRRSLLYRLSPVLDSTEFFSRFWFSKASRLYLRSKPYFAMHYLFNQAVRDRQDCRLQWERTPKYPAEGPHLVAKMGMTAPATSELSAIIDQSKEPMFKLSWKHATNHEGSESVIEYALRSVEQRTTIEDSAQ